MKLVTPPVLPMFLFEAVSLSSPLFLFDGDGKRKENPPAGLGLRGRGRSGVVRWRAESPSPPLAWSVLLGYAEITLLVHWGPGSGGWLAGGLCFFFFPLLLEKTVRLLAARQKGAAVCDSLVEGCSS